MHNKLSFLNSFCVLFFIGKVGHLGTLGAVPWLIVFLPLVLDLILDFFLKLGFIDIKIAWLRVWLKQRALNRIINREKLKDHG